VSAGSYLNYVTDTGADTIESAYGAGVLNRLQTVKAAWIPTTSSGSTTTSRRPPTS